MYFHAQLSIFSGHKNLKPLDTYVPRMATGTKVVWVEPKPNAGKTRVFEPLESDTEAELSEPEEATNEDQEIEENLFTSYSIKVWHWFQ